ncbi:unnamed protein product [Chrysodeixis includens]|uniref:C2H2-type domain-containing protein n=1 Tax=Chrysodeixis includens TaxID=689277 RepID=A0A9N8KTY8_CHRIL|nr:unnamed protein product [Chrysodeixis includens]
MSDEIDIEEHDVMDNPTIRNIFPDLSVIKREINQYFYEGIEDNAQNFNLELPSQSAECLSSANIFNIKCEENEKGYKEFLDCKSDIIKELELLKESRKLNKNVIILGSKPNKDCKVKIENVQNSEPQLILEKIDTFLKQSKRYCNQCLILFPKIPVYNMHRYHKHGKGRRKKYVRKEHIYNLHAKHKCLKCNEILSTRSNLLRHIKYAHSKIKDTTKNVHKNINDNNTTKPKTRQTDQKNQSNHENQCFHCQQFFPTPNSLIEHLYELLTPKNTDIAIPSSKDKEEHDNLNKNVTSEKNVLMPDSVEKIAGNQLKEIITVEKKHLHTVEVKNEIHPKYSVKCDKCNDVFFSKNRLRYHKMKIHKKFENVIPGKNKSIEKTISNQLVQLFYSCLFCSKYHLSMKYYSLHILSDHNVQLVAKAKRVQFESQCIYCPSKMSNVKSYNAHLCRNHSNKVKQHINTVKKKENSEDSVLKSVVFQCLECDTYFLSAQEAMNHLMHSKSLNKWECNVCHKKFKTEDMAVHKKQHESSYTIIEYSLSKSALKLVLYKCFRCTVHYSEHTILAHKAKCDSNTPKSIYCHFCDILVNKSDMGFHTSQHEESNVISSDFTIIETEMLDTQGLSFSKVRNNISGLLVVHFCNTCKCFLHFVKSNYKVHFEARCAHMSKKVCKACGLVFTLKTFIKHARLHSGNLIELQDYLFYDLKSKKQIFPPIPDYPECKLCKVRFLSKMAIRTHVCPSKEYKTCEKCSIKFADNAYKIHMDFHKYYLGNIIDKSPYQNVTNLDKKHQNFLYICKSCQISISTYDDVINHCQDHYDSKQCHLTIQKCQQCGLVHIGIDKNDCPTNLNVNGKKVKVNIDNFTMIEFDPFYVRFDNTFWTRHIFAYISDEQMVIILEDSIYRHECRLKMEEMQPGSAGSILYKCNKCQFIIEPHCLYTHAENSKSSLCVNFGKYPCAHCGLCFSSWKHRAMHLKEHEESSFNQKSFKIILFNKPEHEAFNQTMFDACNKFILYQCRKCERVVDKFQRNAHECDYSKLKMCSNCGLLFHALDYDLHFIRHEELDQFNVDFMFVVMFGQTNDFDSKKTCRSTFKKARLDLTLYKCKKCNLCLQSKKCVPQHDCVIDESKCKCSKCGLYFLEKDILRHCKLHDTHFDEFNANIITYDVTSIANASMIKSNTKDKKILAVEEDGFENPVENDFHGKNVLKARTDFKSQNNFKDKNDSAVKQNNKGNSKIYKCVCGLHFIDLDNARNHVKICNVKMKISRQICSKCNLLFTPGELFNHLLLHHSDKNLQFEFDIVAVDNNGINE